MYKYILSRIAQSIGSLFIVSIIILFIVHTIPGGPAQAALGATASQEAIDELNEQLGLNEPLHVQYLDYYSNILLHGDFGNSINTGVPVSELIVNNLSVTFMLAIGGLGFAVMVGIPFGLISGLRRNSTTDEAITTISLIGLSVPSFVWAILFILIFSLKMGLFPTYGYVSIYEDPIAAVHHLILPTISIGLVYSAVILRYVRVEVMENMNEPYITALKSKGLRRNVVYFKLVKNSLIPTVTVVGLTVGSLISAAVIVEIVFAIPGSGRVLYESILNRDYPVLQGIVLVIAVTYMGVNLIVDILYTYLDPRIKY